MKTQVFDFSQFMHRQVIEALTCPINRHFTRLNHQCDDWFLWHHPELLIEHFLKNGGAEAFALRRAEFQREIEIPDEDVDFSI